MKIFKNLLMGLCALLSVHLSYSQSCNTSVASGATANYLFNNNLNDATTPAYNLTGTGSYSTTNPIEGTHSLNLVGTTNVVQSTSATTTELYPGIYSARTVSMFIKATNTMGTNNQYLIEEGEFGSTNDTRRNISLFFDTSGDLILDMFYATAANRRTITFPFPKDGKVHHVAYTYDGANNAFTLYVDGYAVGGVTDAIGSYINGNSGLSVGNNNGFTNYDRTAAAGTRPFNGLIDDLAIYKSVLTPKQMKDIAACKVLSYLTDLTPMNCPNTAFLVQTVEGDWYDVDLPTGDNNEGTDNLTSPVNAIGYNIKDQRIWGYDRTGNNSGKLVVTSQVPNGTYESRIVGPITGLPKLAYNTGDVFDGKLYLTGNTLQNIQIVDVDPTSNTYLQYLGALSLGVNTGVHDFAINPIDGKAYGIFTSGNSTFNGNLIQIDLDPATADASRRKVLGPSGVRALSPNSGKDSAYGATYFDGDGFLYVSNNETGIIYRLDLSTDPGTDYDETKTIKYADGPASQDNDGAFCSTNIIPLDLGDAPDSYKTLISSDGARHIIGDDFQQPVNFSVSNASSNSPNLMLGSKIDRETVATPSVNANGDNNNQSVGDAGNDEDAITSPIILQGGQSYTIDVGVTNTTGSNAYLSAWVDFNADGDFADAGEQIANDQVVNSGATSVQISNTAPSITNPDDSYARFRICSTSGSCNTFFGLANSGEVEDYTVSLAQGLLPVDLVSFTVSQQNNDAVLQWTTASEINNDRFEILRSYNGVDFEYLGEVKGNGTTNVEQHYAYTDRDIAGSTRRIGKKIFYRLNQIDYDGESELSDIRVITIDNEATSMSIYPNPAGNFTIVDLGAECENCTLKIYNTVGQEVESKLYQGGMSVDTKSLLTGTYVIQIVGAEGDVKGTHRMIKVNK